MEANCFSGELLRDARVAADLKAETVAARIERSVYSVHSYEAGRVQPPAGVVERLAIALDTTSASFYTAGEPVAELEPQELDTHVRAVLAHFPRLNAAQRSRISTLLRSTPAPEGGRAA